MMQKVDKISTGSYDLNTWLYGGYEKDVITMVAGPPGVGKTNLSILVACSQARKGNKVIFVDTEGGFSVDRVKQIVGEDQEKVLNNIFLLEPSNFDEQTKSFAALLSKVKKEHIGLIVIDGMATLYRLALGEASRSKVDADKLVRELNSNVAGQMRILSEISRKQKIPIFLTNQVYAGFLSEEEIRKGIKKEIQLVGGDLLRYWSKCIIELRDEGKRKRAVLLKHRSLPRKEFVFEIRERGIFKKSWL